MASKGNYIMVDESILRDSKIDDLILALGYEGFGFYIALLTLVRDFNSTGYKIPFERLGIIAKRRLNLSEEEEVRFSLFIEKALEIGLFVEDEQGNCFWSERRRIDLLKQEEIKKKQSIGGKTAMEKRYAKYSL